MFSRFILLRVLLCRLCRYSSSVMLEMSWKKQDVAHKTLTSMRKRKKSSMRRSFVRNPAGQNKGKWITIQQSPLWAPRVHWDKKYQLRSNLFYPCLHHMMGEVKNPSFSGGRAHKGHSSSHFRSWRIPQWRSSVFYCSTLHHYAWQRGDPAFKSLWYKKQKKREKDGAVTSSLSLSWILYMADICFEAVGNGGVLWKLHILTNTLRVKKNLFVIPDQGVMSSSGHFIGIIQGNRTNLLGVRSLVHTHLFPILN